MPVIQSPTQHGLSAEEIYIHASDDVRLHALLIIVGSDIDPSKYLGEDNTVMHEVGLNVSDCLSQIVTISCGDSTPRRDLLSWYFMRMEEMSAIGWAMLRNCICVCIVTFSLWNTEGKRALAL